MARRIQGNISYMSAPISGLLDRLAIEVARLIPHADKVDPPLLRPPPSGVWVTFSREAGGARPLATYYVDLDAHGEGTFAAMGSIDAFLALRVRR